MSRVIEPTAILLAVWENLIGFRINNGPCFLIDGIREVVLCVIRIINNRLT